MPTINTRNFLQLLERRQLSLSALGRDTPVSRATLSRIANGHVTEVRESTLERLVTALGTDAGTLTGSDIDIEPSERLFGRKTQMNVRIADDARNALTLVARRYGVKPADIIHISPFLFLWAAEESLKRRSLALNEIEDRIAALADASRPKHLDEIVTQHWHADDAILAEQRSINALDLFGTTIPDEHFSDNYEDSEENPFAVFLKSLADELGELAEFDYWSAWWDHPGYQLGDAEAQKITGGNKEAARQITSGFAPLHEMPREVEAAGPEVVAKWAIERGRRYRKENFPDFGELDLDFGERAND